MRIKNSIKNIYISILTQIIISILGFISRKVFLDNLGAEYLGINGLLTNVISMLGLVEGGIGLSIVYNLYKPLADDDKPKIIALVQLYKKIYTILAIVVFALGLAIYPLLNLIIKDGSNIKYMGVVYFIFVIKNVISYLNAHKWSLINADQKGYILSKYNLLFNIITIVSKIFILQITKNYILFLLIEITIFIIQNIWNGRVVNYKYSYLKTKEKYNIDKDTKDNLIKNVKAIFLHNIGTYCVFGTDNILISAFISLKTVGLYSNYTMVISQLASLLTPVLGGIGASVGNLIATESKEKSYDVFKITYLINFWIYSVSTIFLFNLLEPFITWCFGNDLLLGRLAFFFILLNFYISGMRSSILIFKQKAGIFDDDKYIPLIESAINLGSSIILIKYFGLAGIFMGTTISSLICPVRITPKIVYNKVFNKPVKEYFKNYIIYITLTILVGGLTTFICNFLIRFDGFIALVFKGSICLFIVNIIYIIIFFRTSEFKYILSILKVYLIKFLQYKKVKEVL